MKREDTVHEEITSVAVQKQSMKCSKILNTMVFFGFMVNYMLRVNFTIAIVDMVRTHKPNESVTNINTSSALSFLNDTNTTIIKANSIPPNGIKFNWSEYEQNVLLGSFYCGYILTEIPGGRMAEILGARRVFGYSMLLASIVTLLTPMAAKLGFLNVVLCRVVLGVALGVTWPAALPLAAKWVPPNDRSKFMANMMASTLGAAITLPICGLIISACGWESVFYITGLVSVVWSAMWFNLIFDTPDEHPKISEFERLHIKTEIAKQCSHGVMPELTPWKKMLTSLPVWAIIIAHGCNVTCYFTITNQLPTYMKYILHYNIKENGLVSSLPYLGKYIMALTAGIVADQLLRSEKLPRTATRKVFTFIGSFLPGVMMILQVYFGESQVWSVVIFTISMSLNGVVTGGYLGNGLDIAPNFSGTIFGMANTLASFGGFMFSYIVGRLTNDNQTFQQWSIIFWILAIIYICGTTVFLIFGKTNVLPWNSKPMKKKPSKEEMMSDIPLNEIMQPLNNFSLT